MKFLTVIAAMVLLSSCAWLQKVPSPQTMPMMTEQVKELSSLNDSLYNNILSYPNYQASENIYKAESDLINLITEENKIRSNADDPLKMINNISYIFEYQKKYHQDKNILGLNTTALFQQKLQEAIQTLVNAETKNNK